MILIMPSVLLLCALIALYRWRMQGVPWLFLLVAGAVILQAAIVEAFGVQAGAEVGSSSSLVILVAALLGCAVVKPVWRFGLSAILCVIGAVSAVVAYEIAGIYFDDVLTRIDENPIVLLAAAFILATVGVAIARDLPARPRGLIASPIVLLAIFPLTRIGEAAESSGRYLVYGALALMVAGWLWLISSRRRDAGGRAAARPPLRL